MKKTDNIFDLLDNILPGNIKKTVMFCEVEETAYEVFFYVYYADGSCKQCNELVDEGIIDSSALDTGFEKVANYIRNCDDFNAEARNVVTIKIEGTSETVKMDHYDKSMGLYKIKKDWKIANL
jgi:hypothetical protein